MLSEATDGEDAWVESDGQANGAESFRFDTGDGSDENENENEDEDDNAGHGSAAMSMLMNYYGTEPADNVKAEGKSAAELIKSPSFKTSAYVKELLDTKLVDDLVKHDAQMLVRTNIFHIS